MKIKDLCESERPREKLLSRGADSLSNGELLAILIGSGSCGMSALETAQTLLSSCGGRLSIDNKYLKRIITDDAARILFSGGKIENHAVSARNGKPYTSLISLKRYREKDGDVWYSFETDFPKNKDGWKIGLCGNAPLYSKFSVLCLTNTSAIGQVFDKIQMRFRQLFKAKAYLRHYTDHGAEVADLEVASDIVDFLISEYESVQTEQALPPRPKIIV